MSQITPEWNVLIMCAGWFINWMLYSMVAGNCAKPKHDPLTIIGCIPFSFAILFPIFWMVAIVARRKS